jgi:hypothetical protein
MAPEQTVPGRATTSRRTVAILLAAGAVGGWLISGLVARFFEPSLQDRVMDALRRRDMASLIRVSDWEKIGLFGPYQFTSDKRVADALGIAQYRTPFWKSDLNHHDGVYLIVLVQKSGEYRAIRVSADQFGLINEEMLESPKVVSVAEAGDFMAWLKRAQSEPQ